MNFLKTLIKVLRRYKYAAVAGISAIIVITVILYNYIQYCNQDKYINLTSINSELKKSSNSNKTFENNHLANNMRKSSNVIIYLCGSVKKPGVYTVRSTDVLGEIVSQKGGFDNKADLNRINLARTVKDGEKIYIPYLGEKENDVIKYNSDITLSKGEQQNQVSVNSINSECLSGSQKNMRKININTADETGLESIPGIGPARAKAILEYRSQHGFFKTIQDLDNVNRIGPKTIDSLKEYICVQ